MHPPLSFLHFFYLLHISRVSLSCENMINDTFRNFENCHFCKNERFEYFRDKSTLNCVYGFCMLAANTKELGRYVIYVYANCHFDRENVTFCNYCVRFFTFCIADFPIVQRKLCTKSDLLVRSILFFFNLVR